jgi:hypothetical protein
MLSNKFIRLPKSMCGTANMVPRIAANNCDQALLADDGIADRHDPERLCGSRSYCAFLHRRQSKNPSWLLQALICAFYKSTSRNCRANRSQHVFGAALQPDHRHLVDPHQMTPNQRLKCEFFNFWRSLAYLADHLLARKIFSTRDLIERERLVWKLMVWRIVLLRRLAFSRKHVEHRVELVPRLAHQAAG